ncbi:MAG: ATP-binding protein, partial [Specibacter sp.]
NFIRSLDSAFLRHGRFDYVIPIGLPDAEARTAMWRRFIPDTVLEHVDVAGLVAASSGFSPADIEFAARSASQRALEKAVYDVDAGVGGPLTEPRGPVTEDYLETIADTRATVSEAVAADFLEDIDALART